MKFFDINKKLSEMRNKKSNIKRRVPTDLDDDELADKISRFNRWLAEIAKKYGLNQHDIETMILMLKNGATLEEMSIFASEQQLIHQQEHEQAYQKIKEIDDYER